MFSSLKRFIGSRGLFGIEPRKVVRIVARLKVIKAKLIRVLLFYKKGDQPVGVISDIRSSENIENSSFSVLYEVPSEEIRLPLPETGEDHLHWKFHDPLTNPPVLVVSLDGARFIGPFAYAVSREGFLLYQVSNAFSVPSNLHPVFAIPFLPGGRRIPGVTAVLAQNGHDSYFHWLFEILPMFRLLEQSGTLPDRYLISSDKPFQKSSLSLLGIPQEKMIQPGGDAAYRCETSVVITKTRTVSKWRCDYLRKIFSCWMNPSPEKGCRLYITRNNTDRRRVRNEDEVVGLLSGYGFTVVDPGKMSLQDQVDLFSRAEFIVAPHGGALTNVVFASPGTRLVELFSPGYINRCFWEIAVLTGVGYSCLIGRGRSYGKRDPHLLFADISVDTVELDHVLRNSDLEKVV